MSDSEAEAEAEAVAALQRLSLREPPYAAVVDWEEGADFPRLLYASATSFPVAELADSALDQRVSQCGGGVAVFEGVSRAVAARMLARARVTSTPPANARLAMWVIMRAA